MNKATLKKCVKIQKSLQQSIDLFEEVVFTLSNEHLKSDIAKQPKKSKVKKSKRTKKSA